MSCTCVPNLVLLPQNARFTHIWSLSGWAIRSGVEVWIVHVHVVRKVWCYGHGKFRVVLELWNGKFWVTVVYNNYV